MTPDAYCQDKAARSGSSFTASFRFLPDQPRRAMTALYAFCREVDDLVDETREPEVARVKLEWWRAEIGRLYTSNLVGLQHPITRALHEHVQRYALPRRLFDEILNGMEMDLKHQGYADFSSLALYCYRVASAVGLLSARIFNRGPLPAAEQALVDEYAEALGMALQLTNILRDVGEDVRRGRIYLPQDRLKALGVDANDLRNNRYSSQLQCVLEELADRAEDYFAQASAALERLLPPVRKAQRPGLIMGAVYFDLLQVLREEGFQVLHQKTSLTPRRKLWLALVSWFFPPKFYIKNK